MKKIVTIFLLVLAGCATPKSYGPIPETHDVYASAPAPVAAARPNDSYEEPYASGYDPDNAVTEKVVIDKLSKAPTKQKTITSEPIFNPTSIINQLRYSAFGYSVPKEANIDDDIEVTMIVNPLSSTSKISVDLPDGQKTTGNLEVSRVIQAKLDSNDFIITPITPERQVIIGDRNTVWKWSLSAKEPGPNKVVKITVSAIVLVDGEKTESYVDTYKNVINIDITPKQRLSRWLSANWQWAWGALLIPIIGFFYNRKRKSK